MVQIQKFWFLNPSTNICPSCGNIHSIKMVINNELTREETIKTINFRPHFCIKNHKKWNNSFFPPWTDLKSHIPGTVLTIRFFWCITRLWTRKFLLLGFLDSVPGEDTILSIGHMSQTRDGHAVSVVQVQDYTQWCQWSLHWPALD